MFPIIKNCSLCLEKYLIEKVAEGDNVHDVRDLMARYSIDIIASVGFGIENDCINDASNIFRKIGIQIFEPNFKNGFRKMIQLLMPKMFYKLGQRAAGADVEEFISSIVKQTVEFREQNNFSRNDFMQQLIQLKNQGYVSVDSKIENNQKSQESVTKLNLTDLAAQCFIFYSAGKV